MDVIVTVSVVLTASVVRLDDCVVLLRGKVKVVNTVVVFDASVAVCIVGVFVFGISVILFVIDVVSPYFS